MISSQPTLIHHFLELSAQNYPDKVSLIHDGVRATYAEINSQANQLARHLLSTGVTSGDRVAMLLENSLEYVVSYYATLKAGAVAVPLSTDLKPDGLKNLLLDVEPRAIISSSRFERLLKATDLTVPGINSLVLKSPQSDWSSAPFAVHSLDDLLPNSTETPNPCRTIEPNTLASIIYTSGSTGRPKGVMLAHGNIVCNTLSICQYLCLTPDDIQMAILPFFYVMGKSLLNTHFAVGGTVVVNNKFAFPASVLNEMVAEQVTGFSGVPSTYAYLLHRSPLAKYRDKLPSLRYCSQAGGHMARAVKEQLRQVLPIHTQIIIMYGATEAAARLSYLEPERYLDKMDSIGKAIPGVDLRVLDSHAWELPPGQTGELVATGDNIMQGYWRDPEATGEVLNGCGYRTGDQAYCDEEGYFYIVGRKDELIKVGGHRVNTREIEDVLMESGMFVEAAVLGVPDDLLGHRLIACAVPKADDCCETETLAFCSTRVARFKLPGKIVKLRSLPKGASGKVDRGRCFELIKADCS